MSRPEHLTKGEFFEQQACQFLLQQGLQLIEKNFPCRYGELDLIMRENKTLVIVEVRFRQSNKYGGAVESITPKKQSRIISSTQHYLSLKKIDSPIRFDVIAISGNHEINWIKNAF